VVRDPEITCEPRRENLGEKKKHLGKSIGGGAMRGKVEKEGSEENEGKYG